ARELDAKNRPVVVRIIDSLPMTLGQQVKKSTLQDEGIPAAALQRGRSFWFNPKTDKYEPLNKTSFAKLKRELRGENTDVKEKTTSAEKSTTKKPVARKASAAKKTEANSPVRKRSTAKKKKTTDASQLNNKKQDKVANIKSAEVSASENIIAINKASTATAPVADILPERIVEPSNESSTKLADPPKLKSVEMAAIEPPI
ncbi:MAG: hypothetical protein KUG81_03730, partial [Gammaproteobacteria bacterium]|nr:hypothetical protein [Gammaproteobacteria bacterium]